MSSVFVSYRRDDTRWAAIFVADALRRRLGKERVFLDVEAMRGGEDFRSTIRAAVAECHVLLAMIGPRWGSERLHEPDDLVASEITLALAHDKTIIPVLVDGATVPAAGALPEALRKLQERHAVRLTDHSFRSSVAELCDVVETLLPAAAARQDSPGAATYISFPVGTKPEDVARLGQLNDRPPEHREVERPPPPPRRSAGSPSGVLDLTEIGLVMWQLTPGPRLLEVVAVSGGETARDLARAAETHRLRLRVARFAADRSVDHGMLEELRVTTFPTLLLFEQQDEEPQVEVRRAADPDARAALLRDLPAFLG